MRDVTGKVAFITGGVSGIGLGIAKAFATAGMKVAVTYIREEHRRDAMAWFEQRPELAVLPIQLDVTDRAAMARAADEVVERFGKVHVLCNNAGAIQAGPIDRATYDDCEFLLRVNVGGVINGIVTFLPHIKAHGEGGHVVNVGSMSSFIPSPTVGIYTATKFAVRGITESLRLCLGKDKIGVSLLCPGLTRSNITDSVFLRPKTLSSTGFPPDASALERFRGINALGMDPDEVGRKTLEGMIANRLYIMTHPEFGEELKALSDEVLVCLPVEEPDPRRVRAEEARRTMTASARAASDGI
jgi:NAD(P)-dependent dehydrogenase (short-subunit alcohol dehydrogenase family)